MAKANSLVIFPGSDPLKYEPLGFDPGGGRSGRQTLKVVDSILNGEPTKWALDLVDISYGEGGRDGSNVYAEPDSRTRLLAQSGLVYKVTLTGPVSADQEKGAGIQIGPLSDDPNRLLAMTPRHIAEGMVALATNRHDTLAERGVVSQSLKTVLDRAKSKLEKGLEAEKVKDWQRALGLYRES